MEPLESNDERIESEDNNQFRVVSHTPKFDLENIYENVRDNANLSSLKGLDFYKLGREEQKRQGPLALTQGMGEDTKEAEDVEEKEEEEAPKAKVKERKA